MKKFKNDITLLTEKGKVKTDVRSKMFEKVDAHRNLFADADKVGNGKYEIPYQAPNGQTIYVRFEISVSERSLTSLAEKKPSSKKKAESESIEIE